MKLNFKILVFILMMIYIAILYIPININYKKFKFIKKMCLNVGSFLGIKPMACWNVIKNIYLLIIGGIPLTYCFYKGFVKVYNIYTETNIIKSIMAIVLSFIGVLEISFFIIIVIVSYLMKKDSRKEMSQVSWIKFNKDKPFYTGIIKPIIYALFEVVLYYYLMFYILNDYLKLSFMLSIISIAILYSISKLVLVRNKEQALIYGTWSFSLNFIGSCVLIYTNSITPTFILYLLYSFLICFKEG